MSFNLSQAVSDLENVVGLLPVVSTLLGGVSAIVPSGTTIASKLNVVEAGVSKAITVAGGVEADIAAIWPHLESIFTEVETVIASFSAPVATPIPTASSAS
jgi:hypothetical protein